VSSYSSYSGVCGIFAEGTKDIFKTVSSFDGSVYSDGILSPASPTEPFTFVTSYETDFISPSETAVIAAEYYAVVLVHKEGDESSATTASKPNESGKGEQGDDKSGKDQGDGDGNGDGESAARSLRPTADGLWSMAPVALAAGTVFLTMVLL